MTVGSSTPSAMRLSDSPDWTTLAHAGSCTPGGNGIVVVVGGSVVVGAAVVGGAVGATVVAAVVAGGAVVVGAWTGAGTGAAACAAPAAVGTWVRSAPFNVEHPAARTGRQAASSVATSLRCMVVKVVLGAAS